MEAEKSILFICTGNIYRSMSAEQCFKQYLSDQRIAGWNVGSAGIIAEPASIDPKAAETLAGFGITNIAHHQRKVSKEILDSYDVVVAMAQNHVDFLEEHLGYRQAILFNALAAGEETSVWDIEDTVPDYKTNRPAVEQQIENTVAHIHAGVPCLFAKTLERYYLFDDFVNGRRTHRNGFPFIPLHETEHTVAFMSIEIPRNTDGHILVIPKKRYANFSEVPAHIANELIASLATIGRAVGTSHDGYNILLNNGEKAGQYIFHTHFHVVPRNSGDNIQIEVWEPGHRTPQEFIALNESLKKRILEAW